jgi:carbon-monoxide dehydrogenase large subunit
VPEYIGRPVRRLEDERLITGRGHYAGDVRLPGLAHMAVLRAPIAHGTISRIDIKAAKQIPGVLAVWTATDLPDTAHHLTDWLPPDMDQLGRPVLAADEVNYVGEAIAVVIAEEAHQAHDAVEAIDLELERLPAVVDISAASDAGSPTVHKETDSNVARRGVHSKGDVEGAFGPDAVSVRMRLTAARVCGLAIEPRAVTAEQKDGTLTVWDSTQSVFGVRDQIADRLGIDKAGVTVLADDVGGGFGPKGTMYSEEVLVALAAQRLGRPVGWVGSRSEDSATTVHAHGSEFDLELAATPEGRLLGLRGTIVHDAGAYPAAGLGQPGIYVPHMMSTYVLPSIHVESVIVMTNTAPTGFIRGGGRPLGNFAIERLMDRLARRLELDPAELRRLNLIQPEQMPYDTGYPSGRATIVYDGGDYPRLLEATLKRFGYEEARRRQSEDGRLLGIGIACGVEDSGFGPKEAARLRIEKDGTARLFIGSSPQGQGHQTMAAQVLAERLGWPMEQIEVLVGDTRTVGAAFLTAGSRSAINVGNATAVVARSARALLLERAAEVLEAASADLQVEDGIITVRGVPGRSLPATEVVPMEGIELLERYEGSPTAYPSSCHAAMVEVDPETGSVQLLRYVVTHDTGRAINPKLVEGQMQGGIVHGIGYALFEEAIYRGDGSFASSSLLDYTIAGPPEVATELELDHIETPTEANPEKVKGVGESGTIPAPACIANAVEDALRRVRPDAVVNSIPITPERLHGLIRPGSVSNAE